MITYLTAMDCLKVCPIEVDLMDDDWCYLIFEFAMNYTTESIRYSYHKQKENDGKKVNADVLRKLGYTEEQIQKSKF